MTNVNLIIALFHALFITYLFGMTTYFIMLMLRSEVRQAQKTVILMARPLKLRFLYQYLKLNLRYKTRLHVNCCVISFYYHFSQLLFNFD